MLSLRAALARWQPGAAVRGDPVSIVAAIWPDIVGPELAAHCMPKSIEHGALVILTQSSAWSHQLSFLSDRLLQAIGSAGVTGIDRLRFRIGRLPRASAGQRRERPARRSMVQQRAAAQTLDETLERFRGDVTSARRAKASAGWKECTRCGVPVAPSPGTVCIACENAMREERSAKTARLLFEAPWLGYAGVAPLVGDLSEQEYNAVRKRLLARWWETLTRLRRSGRTFAHTRERLIASSFVLLKSGLDPERIAPAVVRDLLGDQLHDILYLGET